MLTRPGIALPLTYLLLVMMGGLCFAATTLRSFRGCAVREFSFVAHKPGCRGLRVHTEACWGRCQTWEVSALTQNQPYDPPRVCLLYQMQFTAFPLFLSQKPLPEPPYIQRHHRVCTYSRTRHLTARLPGCHPNISPLYHYPHALQCDCAVCSTHHTECQTF